MSDEPLTILFVHSNLAKVIGMVLKEKSYCCSPSVNRGSFIYILIFGKGKPLQRGRIFKLYSWSSFQSILPEPRIVPHASLKLQCSIFPVFCSYKLFFACTFSHQHLLTLVLLKLG